MIYKSEKGIITEYDKNNGNMTKEVNGNYTRIYDPNTGNMIKETHIDDYEKVYDKDTGILIKYTEYEVRNSKLYTKHIFEYDKDTGKKVKLTTEDGTVINYDPDTGKGLSLEYDSNGNKIKEINYNTGIEILSYTSWKYDSNGNVINERLYKKRGIYDEYILTNDNTWEYDNNGKKIKLITITSYLGSIVVDYDPNTGNKVKETNYDLDNNCTSTKEYDPHTGAIIKNIANGVTTEYDIETGNKIRELKDNIEKEYDIKLGKIEKEITYDEETGKPIIITVHEYNPTGNEVNKTTTEYDSITGNKIKMTQTDFSVVSTLSERNSNRFSYKHGLTVEVEYNPDNEKIITQTNYAEDIMLSKITYEYDSETGNKIKEIQENHYSYESDTKYGQQYWSSSNRKIVEFNPTTGEKVIATDYNADGSLSGTTTWEYDDYGNEIKEIEYNSDGSVKKTTSCEYNPENNIKIKQICYNANGFLINETIWDKDTGKIIKYDDGNGMIDYFDSVTGKKTKNIWYITMNNGSRIIHQTKEYDKDTGNLIKDTYNPWGYFEYMKEYDSETGNLIKITQNGVTTEYDPTTGDIIKTIKNEIDEYDSTTEGYIEREFDPETGNKIKETIYKDSYKTTRGLIVYEYDPTTGNIIKETKRDDNCAVILIIEYNPETNKMTKKVENGVTTEYDPETGKKVKETEGDIVREFDLKTGNKVKEIIIDKHVNQIGIIEYSCETGKRIKETYKEYSTDQTILVREYDPETGNIKKLESHYSLSHNLASITEYNSDGKIIKETRYDNNENVISITEYNPETVNKTSESYFDEAGKIISKSYYDENGNWITETY